MRISAKADYAVRAMCELAARAGQGPVKGDVLAEVQSMPMKFLENILGEMKRSGLVASQRGAVGGYWLARPAEQISIADVIRAVEGPLADVRGQRPEVLEFGGAATAARGVDRRAGQPAVGAGARHRGRRRRGRPPRLHSRPPRAARRLRPPLMGPGRRAADERPLDHTPIHTAALPATPVRDRNIPATAWVEAPDELLHLGDDLGGRWPPTSGAWPLLPWRAGPATRADARYLAVDSEDLSRQHSFRLFADGSGDGRRADGVRVDRFRTWKEALRDAR